MEKPLIIFDCDGVLVDSESTTNKVLSDYLNEFGLDFTPKKAIDLFRGGALADCIRYVKVEHNIDLPKEFPSNFRHRMKVAFEERLDAVENIHLLLENLKENDRSICVASNGPLEKMETTLKVTKIKPYFDQNIFSAYQINKWKPDPALFIYAAKEMGFEPENCIVIEDSSKGAQAARKAKMKCFGFAVYDNEASLQAQEAELFYDMKDLINLI